MAPEATGESPAQPSTAGPLRVVVADDSLLVREGVAHLLRAEGMVVAAAVADAPALVAAAGRVRPDVAIVDVRMPPNHADDGLQAACEIRRRWPEVGVLVLSQYVRVTYLRELVKNQVERTGYLLKDRVSGLPHFVEAVRRIGAGGSVFDPEIVATLIGRHTATVSGVLVGLTAREREVLALMAEGLTNAAIAERLRISSGTVEKHCSGIFAKLHLEANVQDHRRVRAVLAYLDSAPDTKWN
jgi:DNA-binding NarL/FixJ family response regulator